MFIGYKIIHVKAHTVPAYSYRRKFTVKEKASAKKLSKNITVRKKKKKASPSKKFDIDYGKNKGF